MTTSALTRRIDVLSQSKPIPPKFIEDRRSVYWVDYYPPTPGPDGTTAFVVNGRQGELANPKRLHPLHFGDRPTPIWAVSKGAMAAEATPRVQNLAQSKQLHPSYLIERSVYTQVPKSALTVDPSSRLCNLAQPKPYKMWVNSHDTIPMGEFGRSITSVEPAALKAVCTSRVETLANAKRPHTSYRPERPVQWPVRENALKAVASLRLQQLARPKSRGSGNDDYDPYKVSLASRLARATPRISELAEPIPRKVRQKKIV